MHRAPGRSSLPASTPSWAWRLVSLLCAFCIALTASAGPTAASTGTDVGGVLAGDTTWTLAGSPYRVTTPVQVPSGVTLTIEPGVLVVATGSPQSLFVVNGTVLASGTADAPIDFDGAGSADFFSGKAATHAVLHLQHARVHDGRALWPATGYSQNAQITVTDSVLSGLSEYSYIWYPWADSAFERNIMRDASGFSVGTDASAQVTFTDNRFIGASRSGFWVSQWAAYGAPTLVTGNTFEAAGSPALELRDGYSSAHLDAPNNFWSTTDASVIDAMILDSADDVTRAGRITYQPILTQPSAATPTTTPSAASVTQLVAADAAVTVTWVAPSSDGGSAITGYTATASPGGAFCTTAGATSCTVTALSNGTGYTFTVASSNAAGTSAASSPSSSVTPLTTASAPSAVTGTPGNASVGLSWTAPDSNGGSAISDYTATATPGGQSCTTTGALACTVTGLTNGTGYTFTVTASNAAGPSAASAPSSQVSPVAPDITAPTATAAATPAFTLGAALNFGFSGTDAGSGLASFDVRYRRAAFNAGFGPLTYPAAWQHTAARSVSIAAIRGATFCFSVRSRDKSGNVSAWSAERCTASVLDDRSVTASTGWTKPASTAYYASTATTIAKTGATLTRTSVQARRIAVVATKCRGCGSIGVYWNGVLKRQISLNSTTTTHRQVINIIDFGAAKAGTLVIKTLNAGRVYIDGVGLSRV